MKHFKFCVACLAIFVMVFTSCIKDDDNIGGDKELATLSFAPFLANLESARAALKQTDYGIPSCSTSTPNYVRVILSDASGNVVGTEANPFRIDLVNNQLFTEEVSELRLVPGTYSLDYFAVYNEDDDMIWIAPRTGGFLANFVDTPLPLSISLSAGVKKYVDVTVLCFDDRDVNEYGYVFVEINPEEAVEYCFFVNVCPPEKDGKDYPARYNVSIWIGTDSTGELLYADVENVTGQNPGIGNYYATPLCFALPSNDNMDETYLYYELTLLSWPENYGTVPVTVTSGTLTMADIVANFDGEDNVDYEHLRFGCPGGIPIGGNPICTGVPTEGDMDGDCIPDAQDNCLQTANPNQADRDNDGFGDVCDLCPDIASEENVECPVVPGNECETAYMFGNVELNSLDYPGNNWGWGLIFDESGSFDDAYRINDDVYEFPVYAGAGQNNTSRGYEAGVIRINLDDDDEVQVQLILNSGLAVTESHIYFGESGWPAKRSPGQLGNTYNASQSDDVHTFSYSGDRTFYLIVHAVTCE